MGGLIRLSRCASANASQLDVNGQDPPRETAARSLWPAYLRQSDTFLLYFMDDDKCENRMINPERLRGSTYGIDGARCIVYNDNAIHHA